MKEHQTLFVTDSDMADPNVQDVCAGAGAAADVMQDLIPEVKVDGSEHSDTCRGILSSHPQYHFLGCGHMVKTRKLEICGSNCHGAISPFSLRFQCTQCEAAMMALRPSGKYRPATSCWIRGLPGLEKLDAERRARKPVIDSTASSDSVQPVMSHVKPFEQAKFASFEQEATTLAFRGIITPKKTTTKLVLFDSPQGRAITAGESPPARSKLRGGGCSRIASDPKIAAAVKMSTSRTQKQKQNRVVKAKKWATNPERRNTKRMAFDAARRLDSTRVECPETEMEETPPSPKPIFSASRLILDLQACGKNEGITVPGRRLGSVFGPKINSPTLSAASLVNVEVEPTPEPQSKRKRALDDATTHVKEKVTIVQDKLTRGMNAIFHLGKQPDIPRMPIASAPLRTERDARAAQLDPPKAPLPSYEHQALVKAARKRQEGMYTFPESAPRPAVPSWYESAKTHVQSRRPIHFDNRPGAASQTLQNGNMTPYNQLSGNGNETPARSEGGQTPFYGPAGQTPLMRSYELEETEAGAWTPVQLVSYEYE